MVKKAITPIAALALVVASLLVASESRAADGRHDALAKEILAATGVKGGFVAHVGCGDGKLTVALRANDSYSVHGVDRDPSNAGRARDYIRSLKLNGKVSVDRLRSRRLPYIDNMANLLVSEDLGPVAMGEVMRVLSPNGVAYVKRGDAWEKTVKPRPEEIDEWTHYLHDPSNNAVAHDSAIGPPRHLQWVGSPRWSRHHDHMSSTSAMVSANGRVFYIFDEGPKASIELPPNWLLTARDAFNGTVLWKRPLGEWHTHLWPLKSGPAQLPRRLVAIGDTVYVTLAIDAPLTALDAATGETIRTYEGTQATEEILQSDGVLFLLVNEGGGERWESKASYATVAEVKSDARERAWDAPARTVMAVQEDSGEILWRSHSPVSPLTLAADARRVYFHDGGKIVALDRTSGEPVWTSEPLGRWEKMATYFGPTLVVYDGVVLYAGGEGFVPHRGSVDTMTALSAETGKTLWTAEHPQSGYQSPEDILVAGGLVWCGSTTNGGYSGVHTGRDPRTGEVKNEFGPDVETHWFHHRCHRAKATDKYLLMSRTGIEFLDISENHWTCHHWVRGGCLYGIMPCNGMVYTPAHDCACYMESKQFGFNALAPASPTRRVPKNVPDAERLERGPAYGQAVRAAAGAGEWPTYRHDGARSGMTDVPVPTGLKQTWETELGGTLSSVVIGEGKLFVASVEDHTVHALDAGSGEPVWSYTTGGRVDSPPTIYEGRALFGSADGWVYCLRAADGELIWRFRAAPDDRKLMAFEQLESVWPVHGSVLVQDGSVYCVAGRSMFVDGGLRFLHLDPETGRKLSETILDDRDPETGDNLQMYVKGLNMTVALPDVLSSDGTYVYMRSMPFDMEGARQRIAYLDVKQQRGEDAHLFSPTGFLDGSWWHRSYWIYGRSMASGAGGYYQAGRVAPAGRIMAFDDENVYGFGRKPQYYRWTTPLEYHLFATNREPPEAQAPARRGEGSWVSVAISDSLNPASKPLAVEAWARPGKKGGVVLARGGPANGYALFVDKGKPHFAVRATSELGSVNGQEDVVGKWVHLAGVLTADKKLQLYVNGELAASGPATGLLASNPAQALEIGADDGGGVGDYASPFGFAGAIDEARVYYGTLTAGEIGTHYSTPGDTAAQNATLALHHTYDDGKATDLSGNENDGIVESADPVPGKLGGALRFKGTRRRGMRQLPYIVEHHWSHEIPLHVRAMVLARERLFIAGPPDLVDEEEAQQVIGDPETQAKLAEQVAAFEGKQGAMLWAVSVADGKRLAEYQLESMPRWDGMAAAGGRLYVSTADGNVLCLAGA